MITIPFDSTSAFTQEVTLDGTPYVFRFSWNFRGEYWTMSLYALDKSPILEGVKIVMNENLLASHPGTALPPGQMWAVAASDSTERIGFSDLYVGKVELVYVPEAEVAAL